MEFSLDEIKGLLDAFEERNMQKLQLKKGDCELLLERTPPKNEVVASPSVLEAVATTQAMHQALPPHFPNPEKSSEQRGESVAVDVNAKFISSPMVGTFYSCPAPGEAAFVGVGDSVKEGDVVCIVEAMKVMNEVKATESGTIKEVLVEDGHPVEFGTKIFKIG